MIFLMYEIVKNSIMLSVDVNTIIEHWLINQ